MYGFQHFNIHLTRSVHSKMNLKCVMKRLLQCMFVLQIIIATNSVNSSHVQKGKKWVHHEIGSSGLPRREIGSYKNDARRIHMHRNRWSGRKHFSQPHFGPWTTWTHCDSSCKKQRERYCRIKRKCGFTKHVEVKICVGCFQHHYKESHEVTAHETQQPEQHHSQVSPVASVSNHFHTPVFVNPKDMEHQRDSTEHYNHFRLPVYQEISDDRHHTNYEKGRKFSSHSNQVDDSEESAEGDYYVIKRQKTRLKKKRKPVLIEVDDYKDMDEDEEDEEGNRNVKPIRLKNWSSFKGNVNNRRKLKNREIFAKGSAEYETEVYNPPHVDEYDDDYYGSEEYGNVTRLIREKAVVQVPQRQKRIYSKWSKWTKCSPKCTTRRYKKCRLKEFCGKEVLREIAYCYTEGTFCQRWLQQQIEKAQTYDIRPIESNNRRSDDNALRNDYIMNGRGYRGPEYEPMKLKCGISTAMRSNRRNMNNLLKIIGGKASRKGEWPWQVAIFNRFKEAFCGGTLIAPQWVLTAAHCLRKVLYVRIGEHNLDFEDGNEVHFKVKRTVKHPSFDKKTVDSDIALLKLPRPVNASTYIDYSCLPSPYQQLPKNIECTVIGWGKRRNRDQSGTSILHQAEVPIIPMENCRSVYHEYNITKNMFCAGHKRGRIDTCAGDSGGPLLCRDTTKPNHPWTIFGITSFGDGCAKKNKFGIYAKVSNYVDWIWSVINCNGNCKPANNNNTRRML